VDLNPKENAMAKKSNGRSPKNGVQEVIPEMAPKKIPAIITAAKRYAERRDERIVANKEEKDAHTFLLEKMAENELDSYEYGDLSIFVDKKTKCKVRIGGEAAKEESENVEE
jgi:hypothetical protein